MRIRPLVFASLALLTAACSAPPPPTEPLPPDTEEFSSSSEDAAAETRNVSYIGTVQPAGITITMEGTHRLDLGDGRFILLASETVDLNGYVGERAEVTGSVRPTVEEGGTIMTVEQIRLLEASSSSFAADPGVAVSSIAPASAAAASSAQPVAASSAAPLPASSRAASAPPPPPADQSAQVKAMAQQNLAAANWTQAYCAPPAAGFCFPIHRNWYFTSFGAQTQALWHVEVGPEAIESVGQGAIAVNLLGGDIAAEGVADGTVRTEGGNATGYRAWSKDRHMEITAPAALQDAVAYITSHLTPASE